MLVVAEDDTPVVLGVVVVFEVVGIDVADTAVDDESEDVVEIVDVVEVVDSGPV